MLMKAKMASLLPDDGPTIASQSVDELDLADTGDDCHRLISRNSDPGDEPISSSTGSR
jgi:hypothetical protein